MGTFPCVCDQVIAGAPTDFMRARAHLIPDQDGEVTGRPNGELWRSDGDPTQGGIEFFDDRDHLSRRCDRVFQERRARGKVRHSFLRIDDTIVHRWPPS